MKKIIVAIFVLLLITIPYIFAATSPNGEVIFGGFLLNPKDGNSYLAKMYQGFTGNWLFSLPFTVEIGDEKPLFTFYLFLGHIARWFRLDLIWMFHLSRVGAAGILLWTLAKFSTILFPDAPNKSDLFYVLATVGSGMGWLLFGFGVLTSDLWVAEAFPFLSMYVNPHFPLGLGLMLWLLILPSQTKDWRLYLLSALLGLLLSIILPFGMVIVGLVFGVKWLWRSKSTWTLHMPWEGIALIPGAIWVGVQYLITVNDPLLKIWNQQNVTQAPVIWDWIISFSPALILMFFALNRNKMDDEPDIWKGMLIWVAAATIIQVVPFSLQRRFLLGFYVPLVGYAVQAIYSFKVKVRKWLIPVVLLLSIPTNIMIIFLGFYATQTQSEDLYINPSDLQAYAWIEETTPEDAVILCSAETGGRIPGRTGRKVVYGHEFETVYAINKLEQVADYFQDPLSENSIYWARVNQVDYIYIGQNEEKLMDGQKPTLGRIVYSTQEVTIFEFNSP